MKVTAAYAIFFLIITLLQKYIQIGIDRTYFSYYLPYLLFISRFLFLGRTLGIPVPKTIAPVSELAVLALSLFFFAVAAYKHHFEIYTFGLIFVIATTLIIISMEVIHDALLIYTHIDEEEGDD